MFYDSSASIIITLLISYFIFLVHFSNPYSYECFYLSIFSRCSDVSEAGLTNEFRRLSCHSHLNGVRERCNQQPAVVPIPSNNGARAPRAIVESPDPGYINHLLSTMRSRADVKSKQFDLKLTPLPFHELV